MVDLACDETVPPEMLAALEDENVTKWAFNAQFERVCLSKYLGLPEGEYLDPESWRCSMVWSAYLGLPLSLEGAGAVLGLEKQKLSEGKDLIRTAFIPREGAKFIVSDFSAIEARVLSWLPVCSTAMWSSTVRTANCGKKENNVNCPVDTAERSVR